MWLDLTPLRENTSLIQGCRITFKPLTWIMGAWDGSGPHRGSADPPMVGPQAHISIFCIVLHENISSTSGTCYWLKHAHVMLFFLLFQAYWRCFEYVKVWHFHPQQPKGCMVEGWSKRKHWSFAFNIWVTLDLAFLRHGMWEGWIKRGQLGRSLSVFVSTMFWCKLISRSCNKHP